MRIERFITLAPLALMVSGAALADDQHFYLTGGFGANVLEDTKIRDDFGDHGRIQSDVGFGGFLGTGYQFDSNFAAELDLLILRNDLDKATVHGIDVPADGHTSQYAAFANLIYDIPLDNAVAVPYIGAGPGAAHLFSAGGLNGNGGGTANKNVFAFDALAGVDFPITDEFKAGLQYRFVDSPSVGFGYSLRNTSVSNHLFMVTLRYDLEEPAPPPPPPAPPVAAPSAPPAPTPELHRAFQVFFDFDKSTITAAAADVIRQAADTVKAGNFAQIAVIGHTDTVGSAKYNQALSIRRATAVRQELVNDGVQSSAIATTGVGKTGLLVPTGDGVREAQNRRAEINLQ